LQRGRPGTAIVSPGFTTIHTHATIPPFPASSPHQTLSKMKNQPWKVVAIVAIAFATYYFLDELYFRAVRSWFISLTGLKGVSHILTYILSGIPLFIGTGLICGLRGITDGLGLNKSIPRAFLFAFVVTLPMLLGYAVVFEFNRGISLDAILISAVSAGFFEEVFFRAFLYGLLFRYTRFGFIPSVVGGALFFASVHLYQSQEVGELIGIFLTTLLGGFLFAWAYSEWEHNIWVPVFIHLLMNLHWMLFSAGDNALGDLYANIFRYSTVALAIAGTIWYRRKQGLSMAINKRTVWMKAS
jgi:uncharacterized protein